MPEGDDPDDVIKKYGAQRYQQCLDSALPLVDYKLLSLERKYDITQTEGKRAYAQAAMPVIRESASAAEREDLLKTVRDKTGFTYQSLSRDLEDYKPSKEEKTPTPVRIKQDKSDRVKKASRFLVGAVLFHQPYAQNYDLKEEDFAEEVHRTVVRYINFCRESGQKIRVSDLFEIFGEDSNEFNEILDLNTEERLLGAGAERYFKDSVKTVALWRLQQKIATVTQKISEETSADVRRSLAAELTALTKELKNYQS